MKSFSFAALLLAACGLFVSPVAAGDGAANWTTDYAAALATAKAENKRVVLFFTGSDWCGWCKRLQAEVLTKPEFAAYANESLVLVELDFPNRKKLPAALTAQNEKLLDKFKVEGFPTLVVLNNAGKKIGEIGYQAGGPVPFVEALKQM
jgi:protein disulfide-isomerase